MLNAKDISSKIAERLSLVRETQSEWDVVAEVVQEEIEPRVPVDGGDAILAALLREKADPLVAAVLVDVSGQSDVQLPRSGREFFRIDEVFTDEEILNAALLYLQKFPCSGLSDGQWGWTALWNGWDQLDGVAHQRLVRKLIERAPDSDEILTLIADGPVRELIYDRAEGQELELLARSDTKVARVLELMRQR